MTVLHGNDQGFTCLKAEKDSDKMFTFQIKNEIEWNYNAGDFNSCADWCESDVRCSCFNHVFKHVGGSYGCAKYTKCGTPQTHIIHMKKWKWDELWICSK